MKVIRQYLLFMEIDSEFAILLDFCTNRFKTVRQVHFFIRIQLCWGAPTDFCLDFCVEVCLRKI